MALERLGGGVFGEVMRCLDVEREAHVAIKKVHTYELYYEADVLLTIRGLIHAPYLVDTFEIGMYTFLIMDCTPGQSLEDIVKHRKRLEQPFTYAIFIRVASVLVYIHDLGIIHRDVKPENIVVQIEPLQVTLVDWGFACKVEDACRNKGSMLYSAPELVVSLLTFTTASHIGPENDVWSLAASIYQTLTGVPHINETAVKPFIKRLAVLDIDYGHFYLAARDVVFFRKAFVPFLERPTAAMVLSDLETMSAEMLTT